jgi:rhodanese-related sulfurtransferase
MLMDLPSSFELVDIRPASHFVDYALPGAKNVDIAELLNNPVYLSGNVPLVIVDRDGSLAMMAAGILSQKTKRIIKALFGGLEAYWEAAEKMPAVRAVPIPGSSPSVVPVPAAPGEPSAPTPAPSPAAPKKKSAGC